MILSPAYLGRGIFAKGGIFVEKRTNTAKWIENQKRWQVNVQKDGVHRSFTSSKPGQTGQREINAKAA